MSIAVTSSGVDVVCWGAAMGPVMWAMDLFCGGRGLDGGAVSVRYDYRESPRMFVWCMYVCHVGSTRVDKCVGALGSLRCRGVFAGRRSVALRVSILVRNWRSDAYCPLFGSLASIASMFRMCS